MKAKTPPQTTAINVFLGVLYCLSHSNQTTVNKSILSIHPEGWPSKQINNLRGYGTQSSITIIFHWLVVKSNNRTEQNVAGVERWAWEYGRERTRQAMWLSMREHDREEVSIKSNTSYEHVFQLRFKSIQPAQLSFLHPSNANAIRHDRFSQSTIRCAIIFVTWRCFLTQTIFL